MAAVEDGAISRVIEVKITPKFCSGSDMCPNRGWRYTGAGGGALYTGLTVYSVNGVYSIVSAVQECSASTD
jgi:hypothetical protein